MWFFSRFECILNVKKNKKISLACEMNKLKQKNCTFHLKPKKSNKQMSLGTSQIHFTLSFCK